MTDTTTPLLGLLLMGTGGDNNSWGTNLNTSVIGALDTIIAGVGTIAATGGSLTPTSAQLQPGTISFTGALTSDQTVVIPSTARTWRFLNNCSGNFFMLIQTSGGTPVNLPAGKFVEIISDGTGAVYRSDAYEVGQLFYHGGVLAPAGAIECTGGTPKRASAVDLYKNIGTAWGAGDGISTFTLPNGYSQASGLGCFLRSRTAAVSVGYYQANQNLSHSHNGGGTTGGENAGHVHGVSGSGTTGSENATHVHQGQVNLIPSGGGANYSAIVPIGTGSGASNLTTEVGSHGHAYSFTASVGTESAAHGHGYSFTTGTGSADGAEARPEALTAMLCIKY